MNILFFCHADFTCNSMGHIAGFAERLHACGHRCAAAIPGDDRASMGTLGTGSAVRPFLFSETWERANQLFPDGRAADVIHAWTPREHVRRAVERCREAMPGARLVVHLEDNEEFLSASSLGVSVPELERMSADLLAARLPVHLSHPRAMRRFLGSADGVTGIVRELREFAPPGVAFAALWPGVDFTRFQPGAADPKLRAELGVRAEEKMVVYPGNSHFANAGELGSLYEAVFLLNRSGVACRLVRTGYDTTEFLQRFAVEDLERFVVNLGFVERERLPELLRLADVLVQPGEADDFNRYRLPSKLPEFLAMGRPVVLPRANVGLRVWDGREALVLGSGQPEEIARLCRRVFEDAALAARLAWAGEQFARRWFDPAKNARGLARFYEGLGATGWRAWWPRGFRFKCP